MQYYENSVLRLIANVHLAFTISHVLLSIHELSSNPTPTGKNCISGRLCVCVCGEVKRAQLHFQI